MNIYEFMMALGLNGSIEDLSMVSKEESKMREMDVWNVLERERSIKQENELRKRENEALYGEVTALKADLETAQKKLYEANARNGKLVTENQDLNRQLKKELEEVKTMLRENNELINKLDNIYREGDLRARCNKLVGENMALRALLTEKDARIKDLRETVGRML